MNKIKSIICLIVFMFQTMPIAIAIPYRIYSDIGIENRVSACVDGFLGNEIEIYNKRISTGEVVYGGIEKLKNDFKDKYIELCEKKIKYETSKYNVYKIVIIILFYTIPSMYFVFLSHKKLLTGEFVTANNYKSIKFYIFVIVSMLVSVLGFCFMWDFGLSDTVHKITIGRILF